MTRQEIEDRRLVDAAVKEHNDAEWEALETAHQLATWLNLWVQMSYLQWHGTRDELQEQLDTKNAVEAWLAGDE